MELVNGSAAQLSTDAISTSATGKRLRQGRIARIAGTINGINRVGARMLFLKRRPAPTKFVEDISYACP